MNIEKTNIYEGIECKDFSQMLKHDATGLPSFYYEKIDFIKVDIEGFEMNFLQGAKETIKKFKPRLFFEIDEKSGKTVNTKLIRR